MSRRYQRFRQISKLLPRILPGNQLHKCRKATSIHSAFSTISVPNSDYDGMRNTLILHRGFYSQRYSTISEVSHESNSPPVDDVLSFIKSTFNELQGPNHCWLNKVDHRDKDCLNKDGIFLLIAGQLINNSQIVFMIEKIKSIQQRFPQLCIVGFHCGSSIGSADDRTRLVELIMKEFLTFPVLLSSKNFLQMENGACYILFKDFKNSVIYHDRDLDIEILNKAIEELHMQQNGYTNSGISNLRDLKSSWVKQAEVTKEPCSSSFLQNLVLYFPGCVSADESGDRLFLSDSNHHRIIIFDGNGKIMDSIGSCPGFEDGEFESAKLLRPAASFYHNSEDCLYIVDAENQAIRRADMERRVLETLYPTCSISKNNSSVWTWIVNKMGFGRNSDMKSKEFDSQLLMFPWHLFKSVDDSLLIINRSFESLWIMDLASGKIKEIIRGFPKILETCGQLITEKVSLLKQMPNDWLQQQIDASCSPEGLPFASLLSSVTTFQNHLIMCDTVAQRVVKLNRESGICSNIQFSNFGILGFPYWSSFPLERVYSEAPPDGGWMDHLQSFSLLPGRIDIRLNVDIPVDVDLVEPLQEGCIWRQARGAATEILGREGVVGTSEKVGVAQQWYDDLDNLAFSTPESEMVKEDSCASSDVKSEDKRVHIDCSVNTSPGTSEVIIYVALYLKLRRDPDSQEVSQEKYAARIADILNPARKGGIGRDSCIQLLLKSNADLRDLIFMRPLHVRIKMDCPDHPKSENGKDIILTNDSIEVNVMLQT
ncbi:catalytic, putative [Ricinus communis]|uniref:Catalytic, putative n=1 Tax=Ricinus communis TaxID=3988 RepID=B9S538_RICCO|nr:catalytic, putative [Ricinus communis]|eukprot:XP_002521107.1 uncharacterized protein LOC8264967 [Ricinus communis]